MRIEKSIKWEPGGISKESDQDITERKSDNEAQVSYERHQIYKSFIWEHTNNTAQSRIYKNLWDMYVTVLGTLS